MSDSVDETRRWGLIIVTAVVSLVVAGVVGLGVSKALHRAPAAKAQVQTKPSTAFKLYFESGSATLPADAQAALGQVSDLARSSPGTNVIVSGFHDATGDPQLNAELAKHRAEAVKHALEANGVDPYAISLSKPQLTMGGTDAKEARRVEITVH